MKIIPLALVAILVACSSSSPPRPIYIPMPSGEHESSYACIEDQTHIVECGPIVRTAR